jgi:hypothetical protein
MFTTSNVHIPALNYCSPIEFELAADSALTISTKKEKTSKKESRDLWKLPDHFRKACCRRPSFPTTFGH